MASPMRLDMTAEMPAVEAPPPDTTLPLARFDVTSFGESRYGTGTEIDGDVDPGVPSVYGTGYYGAGAYSSGTHSAGFAYGTGPYGAGMYGASPIVTTPKTIALYDVSSFGESLYGIGTETPGTGGGVPGGGTGPFAHTFTVTDVSNVTDYFEEGVIGRIIRVFTDVSNVTDEIERIGSQGRVFTDVSNVTDTFRVVRSVPPKPLDAVPDPLAVTLTAYTPNGGILGELPLAVDTNFMVPYGDFPALTFKYPRVGAGSEFLAGPIEIAVAINGIEVAGGRFAVLASQRDDALPYDGELASYVGKSWRWLLNKAQVSVGPSDTNTTVRGINRSQITAEAWTDLVADGWFTILDELDRIYPPAGAQYVNRADVTQAAWEGLRAAGWAPNATDGADRVFPPSVVGSTGERWFGTATGGRIMDVLINEAQAAGFMAGWSKMFTATKTSSGAAWAKVVNLGYKLGLPYETILANLIDQGVVDAVTQGRMLILENGDGLSVDRTLGANPVILRCGRDITEAPRQGTYEDLVTDAMVLGDDGLIVRVANSNALRPWGKWSTFISQGGVKDEGTLRVLAQATLTRNEKERVQHTHGLCFYGAQYLPFEDYHPGDWVFVDRNGTLERERVRAITLDAAGTGNVVLNDRFIEAEIALTRRVNGITGGASAGGGSGAEPAPYDPGADTLKPGPPGNVLATSDAYLTDTGAVEAQVTVSWTAPTINVDGSTIEDLAAYEIGYRIDTINAAIIVYTKVDHPELVATLSPFPPNVWRRFSVRAIDRSGNVGPWSGEYRVLTASDAVAPPAPSTPQVEAYLGQVRVLWDGLSGLGGDMPTDFDHLEVHASLVSQFTPIDPAVDPLETWADTLNSPGVSILTGYPYGTVVYVRFIAVDTSGNRSEASEQAFTTTARVSGLDIADLTLSTGKFLDNAITAAKLATDSVTTRAIAAGAVGTTEIFDGAIVTAKIADATIITAKIGNLAVSSAKIADAAILRAKIADLAVDDAKIANLSVGKITAGILTADVINAGRIATGPPGTARVTFEQTGIRKVRADNSVDFDLGPNIAYFRGTIEGSLFRTTGSGQRMEIQSAGEAGGRTMTWYPELAGRIAATVSSRDDVATGHAGIRLDAGGFPYRGFVNLTQKFADIGVIDFGGSGFSSFIRIDDGGEEWNVIHLGARDGRRISLSTERVDWFLGTATYCRFFGDTLGVGRMERMRHFATAGAGNTFTFGLDGVDPTGADVYAQRFISTNAGGTGGFVYFSDGRKKKNVRKSKMGAGTDAQAGAAALALVEGTPVRDYEWGSNNLPDTGFVAQEVPALAQVMLDQGTLGEDIELPLGYSPDKMIVILWAALQELASKGKK